MGVVVNLGQRDQYKNYFVIPSVINNFHVSNPYFSFKQFTIYHDKCSMKVTTDSCLFGAWVANDIKGPDADKHILDIGSGSGLLSLMLAQQTFATIDGVELQKEESDQSKENVSSSPFKDRITIHQADALQFEYTKKYDVIISNPPFYESDLKGHVKGKNIAHHNEGLRLQELMVLISRILNPTGCFYLLLPAKRILEIENLAKASGLFLNKLLFVHQTEKHPAFRLILSGSFRENNPETQTLFIRKDREYSLEFKSLLQEYYLHL